jgi:polyisoprenoid-binding protein YceI
MKSKKWMLGLGLAVAIGIAFVGCGKKNQEVSTESGAAANTLDGSGDTYLVDTVASVIEWIGGTPTNYKHTGNLRLKDGKFTANENRLTSGKFTISINSINNLDQSGKDKSNLEEHLKNSDFFEVEKFPFGQFEITQTKTDSTGQKVIGNLTLKGKTNTIEIPVTLLIDENKISAETPEFVIDRTKWGIVYQSGIIGTLKDDLINDEIIIKLKIVANKQVQ